MAETIGREDIIRMLGGAIAKIRAGHETLSKLDSVIGDGDHGTTMVRAMGLVEKTMTECASPDLKGMLNGAGATTLMELFIVFRRVSQVLKEKGIVLARGAIDEFLTVQEMAGFQMCIARMDKELLALWDAPCDTPYMTVR